MPPETPKPTYDQVEFPIDDRQLLPAVNKEKPARFQVGIQSMIDDFLGTPNEISAYVLKNRLRRTGELVYRA